MMRDMNEPMDCKAAQPTGSQISRELKRAWEKLELAVNVLNELGRRLEPVMQSEDPKTSVDKDVDAEALVPMADEIWRLHNAISSLTRTINDYLDRIEL